MCRFLGALLFVAGSVGLLFHQLYLQKIHTETLQEMNRSLLRLHNAVSLRHLPITEALAQEGRGTAPWLGEYYQRVCKRLEQHQGGGAKELLWEARTGYLLQHVTKEEQKIWIDAFYALFCVHSPGDDKGFFACYDFFDELQKRDYKTKKERQKVTACTMGTGLVMLLLLLL